MSDAITAIYSTGFLISFVLTGAGLTNSSRRFKNILIDIFLNIIVSFFVSLFWPIFLALAIFVKEAD